MSKPDFPCTACGGDAFYGWSNLRSGNAVLITKDERLCLPCAKKRAPFITFPLSTTETPPPAASPGETSAGPQRGAVTEF
jgi:hypothetical protein